MLIHCQLLLIHCPLPIELRIMELMDDHKVLTDQSKEIRKLNIHWDQ